MSGTVDPDDEDFEIPKIPKNKRKNCNKSKKKKKKKKRDWTDELKDDMSKDEQRFLDKRKNANDAVTCLHTLFDEFHVEVNKKFETDYQYL